MGGMRPASAASEAIEAEVSLKVWDVLHGTLRWASEAYEPCEAGLCDLRDRQLCGFEKYIVRWIMTFHLFKLLKLSFNIILC